MSISENIFIGIISGIITFFIIEFCRTIFFKIVLPWIESTIYNDVDLTDIWEEEYETSLDSRNPDVQVQDIILELNQKVNKITGVCTLTDRHDSQVLLGIRRLSITGKTKNRYVSLTLELNNKRKFGIVNYLLEVTSEGDKMEGFTSYYDPDDEVLRTTKTVLKRKRETL